VEWYGDLFLALGTVRYKLGREFQVKLYMILAVVGRNTIITVLMVQQLFATLEALNYLLSLYLSSYQIHIAPCRIIGLRTFLLVVIPNNSSPRDTDNEHRHARSVNIYLIAGDAGHSVPSTEPLN
jgi:hypothetical protein